MSATLPQNDQASPGGQTCARSYASIAEAAEEYADLGFKLLYLDGKSPNVMGDGWQRGPSATPDHWEKHPGHNIGCQAGPVSGFWGIDPDTPAAEAWLQKLAKLNGEPLECHAVFRSRKGLKRLFKWPSDGHLRNWRKKPVPSCPTLEVFPGDADPAKGFQLVFPPSVHPDDGSPYQWV